MQTIAALALLLPCPQNTPEGGSPGGAPEVEVQVALAVVGDDLVLLEEIDAVVRSEAARGRIPAGNPAAISKLASSLLTDRVEDLLKINAGRNIGFDEATTEAFAERAIEREFEARGGAVDMAAYFEEVGVSPEQYKTYNRERLYLDQWNLIVTGRIPAHLGRPKVDRFIRPGQRWASYQYLARSRSELERELVGALPERLELQRMVLPFGDAEEEAAARELARAILQGLEAGSEFEQLAGLHGLPQVNDGRMQPASLRYVEEFSELFHGSSDLAQWAADAEPGHISGVQLSASPSWPGGNGLLIYRLVAIHPPTEAAPYLDFELQAKLDQVAKQQLDSNRTQQELERVKRHTFIWPRDAGAGPTAELPGESAATRIDDAGDGQ